MNQYRQKLYNFRGKEMGIMQIAAEIGTHYSTLYRRVKRGESIEAAVESINNVSFKGNNNPAFKHGSASRDGKTPTYETWKNMRRRCRDANTPQFKDYGARGIAVCERWNSFMNFLEDMGEKPTSSHSIERVDNSKGYSLANCKWATRVEQNRNRRTTIVVEFNGENKPLSEWCAMQNVNYKTAKSRWERKLPVEMILSQVSLRKAA